MNRLAWLLAGIVIGCIASGYLEGFLGDVDDDRNSERAPRVRNGEEMR